MPRSLRNNLIADAPRNGLTAGITSVQRARVAATAGGDNEAQTASMTFVVKAGAYYLLLNSSGILPTIDHCWEFPINL